MFCFVTYGYFDKSTGEIVLNADAQNPVQVILKHELTHNIEENKDYTKFSDNVLNNSEFKAWLRNNGYADLTDAQNKTIAFRKKKGDTNFKKKDATQEELNAFANQELLADFIAEKLFNDADGLDRLLKSLEPKTMRDFVQTILDVIRKLINKIKGVDNSFEEDLRTLEKKFSKMLKETAKNEKSTGEGVKNSLSPTKIKRLEQILDDLGKKQIKIKGKDKTLTILTDKFTRNKAIFSIKGRTNGEVNARIKAIPDFESILRKAGTFKKENLTSLDNDAKKGVVAIYKGKTQYNGYDIEIVIRDKGAKQYLYEIKFIDPKNKKSSRQSMTEYSASPASQSEDATSKYNIPQTRQSVNKKLSVTPEKESEYMSAVEKGDTETAQRLVDEAAANAGYTQKAYHGTGADFNIFSEENIGKRNVWGKGFYFGTSKGIADDYASLRASKGGKYRIVNAYLKMDNPYISHKSDLGTAEEIKDRWFSDMWDNSRELGIGYIQGKLDNSPLDLLQFIAEHNNIEVQDVLKEYGYDSVKDGGELVVFNPNQIKSSDPVTYDDDGNVIPLSERFNEEETDIRYSIPNASSRAELADALSTLTQDEYESKIIADYKNAVADIDKAQARLDQVNADIKQILFTHGQRDEKPAKAGFCFIYFPYPLLVHGYGQLRLRHIQQRR